VRGQEFKVVTVGRSRFAFSWPAFREKAVSADDGDHWSRRDLCVSKNIPLNHSATDLIERPWTRMIISSRRKSREDHDTHKICSLMNAS